MTHPALWTAERLWPNATVVVIGGGPSLTIEQVTRVGRAHNAGKVRAIAINDAIFAAGWADALWATDYRWWADWHDFVPGYTGLRVSFYEARWDRPAARAAGVKLLLPDESGEHPGGYEPRRTHIRTGKDGGHAATHLAAHLGAARVILLGIDMRVADGGRTHCHGGHVNHRGQRVLLEPTVFERTMLPRWRALAADLDRLGIGVVNASPGSALDLFPRAALEDLL